MRTFLTHSRADDFFDPTGAVFGTLLGALVMATVIQGMGYTGLENWIQLEPA